jgi:hypothetical protein
MITNPMNMALKGVPKIEEQDIDVKKKPSKGLLLVLWILLNLKIVLKMM